jgi:hypothetical protein
MSKKIKVADNPATDLRKLPLDEAYEQLMRWDWDCGCEAACPEGCWVEPDGWCEHGYPSWMLVYGVI